MLHCEVSQLPKNNLPPRREVRVGGVPARNRAMRRVWPSPIDSGAGLDRHLFEARQCSLDFGVTRSPTHAPVASADMVDQSSDDKNCENRVNHAQAPFLHGDHLDGKLQRTMARVCDGGHKTCLSAGNDRGSQAVNYDGFAEGES